MRIASHVHLLRHIGYIAGTGDGIVTVGGVPSSRKVYVLDDTTLAVVKTAVSLDNGQYLITDLDPNGRYLVMARDYKGEYEPVCYDNVAPASDLTADEIRGLWERISGLSSPDARFD